MSNEFSEEERMVARNFVSKCKEIIPISEIKEMVMSKTDNKYYVSDKAAHKCCYDFSIRKRDLDFGMSFVKKVIAILEGRK